jgi:putative ABC transport system substrate-binding protein
VKQRQNVGTRCLMLRRRDLITLLGGAAIGWPHIAVAQQKAMPVIGFLGTGSAESDAFSGIPAFRAAMSRA